MSKTGTKNVITKYLKLDAKDLLDRSACVVIFPIQRCGVSRVLEHDPTKRLVEGRDFSVSAIRFDFWRSNSSRIWRRCLASMSSRRPSGCEDAIICGCVGLKLEGKVPVEYSHWGGRRKRKRMNLAGTYCNACARCPLTGSKSSKGASKTLIDW